MRVRPAAAAVRSGAHGETDAGPAVVVPVIEHQETLPAPDDDRIRRHLGVPTAGGWRHDARRVAAFPHDAILRLGVADAVRRAPVRIPHAIEIPVAKNAWAAEGELIRRAIVDTDDARALPTQSVTG